MGSKCIALYVWVWLFVFKPWIPVLMYANMSKLLLYNDKEIMIKISTNYYCFFICKNFFEISYIRDNKITNYYKP